MKSLFLKLPFRPRQLFWREKILGHSKRIVRGENWACSPDTVSVGVVRWLGCNTYFFNNKTLHRERLAQIDCGGGEKGGEKVKTYQYISL